MTEFVTQMQVRLQLTPEQVAEAFCAMSPDEMARFFAEGQRLSKLPDWSAHGIYGQALWLADVMPVGSPGADFLMDLAAPWYTHTLRYIDTHGERERA